MTNLKWAVLLFAILLLIKGLTADASTSNKYLKIVVVEDRTYYVLKDMVDLDINAYKPLLNALSKAKKGSKVHIVLDRNRGGYVSTMDVILKHMKDSKAVVHTYVNKFAASAAAEILSHGDVVHMSYNVKVLWHTGAISLGFGLKLVIRPVFDSYGGYFKRLYWSTIKSGRYLYDPPRVCGTRGCLESPFYRSILNAEQWMKFSNGDDVILTGKEICANIGTKYSVGYYGVRYCTFRGYRDEQR